MKISKIKDVDAFFSVINSCKGTVALVSKEGDNINLKSKLSQMLSLAKVFSDGSISHELELVAYEPEDVIKITNFLTGQ